MVATRDGCRSVAAVSREVEDLNRRLLRETDRSVTDICVDVGFTSLGTFSRTFREIVGATPSDYRVMHGPMGAPNCFQMAVTRPVTAAGRAMRSSSSGEAPGEATP